MKKLLIMVVVAGITVMGIVKQHDLTGMLKISEQLDLVLFYLISLWIYAMQRWTKNVSFGKKKKSITRSATVEYNPDIHGPDFVKWAKSLGFLNDDGNK